MCCYCAATVLLMCCEIISDKMGGGIAYDKYLDFGYGTEVQRCKVQKKIKKSQKSVYRGFLE